MKIITILFLLFTLNMSAQFLSYSKDSIASILVKNKIEFTSEITLFGEKRIVAPNISGCSCQFIFTNNVCHKEIITALSDNTIIDMIMDLNNRYYIQLEDDFFIHEESYGIVEVRKDGNTFTFTY